MANIQKMRQDQFIAQGGNCYYCQQPMWYKDPVNFADNNQLSIARAVLIKATAEHLIDKSDGGDDSHCNIVAACHYCNALRHRTKQALTPEKHLQKVRRRLKGGKWHGIQLR
jgi:5-methylcytosine-specific restriction endonuclease McrA